MNNLSAHFERLQQLLTAVGVDFTINPCLVRGLDYYNGTVFEWVTSSLGAQGTVCAGGRYDSLVEQLGGKSMPAIGMGIGMERLVLLMEEFNPQPKTVTVDVYMIMLGTLAEEKGWQLLDNMRNLLPQLVILPNLGGGNMKAQMKRADKSGAHTAILLGEEEIAQEIVIVKALRRHATDTTQGCY